MVNNEAAVCGSACLRYLGLFSSRLLGKARNLSVYSWRLNIPTCHVHLGHCNDFRSGKETNTKDRLERINEAQSIFTRGAIDFARRVFTRLLLSCRGCPTSSPPPPTKQLIKKQQPWRVSNPT